MNKNESKKKQFFVFGLCSFLALVLCMATLVVTVKKVEGAQNNSENTEQLPSKTELSDKNEDIAKYIRNLTSVAVGNNFIKVNSYTDVYVDNSSVLVDGETESADKSLFVYLKDRVMGVVDEVYGEDKTGVFGVEDNSKPYIDLVKENNLTSLFSVGQTDENGKQIFDDNGNLVDSEFYYITLSVAPKAIQSDAVKDAFNFRNKQNIITEIKNTLLPDCEAEFISVDVKEIRINAKINRFTDQISQVEIQRVYNVKAEFEFLNTLSVFGTKIVEFQYGVNEKYEYFYAGVTLSQSKMTIEKGKEAQLTVNAVIENDSEYKVKFISSDESIATVDEMGYVTVLKEEPVIITVQLEYLGEIFTDKCVVNGQEVLL